MRKINSKLRLLVAVISSLLVYAITPKQLQLVTRILIGWNGGVICLLALSWLVMTQATPRTMRSQAQRQDENRWLILAVVVVTACSSLLAIVFMLNGSKDIPQAILVFHIILALLTIFASWLLIHIMFAIHYAHLYYYSDRFLHTNTTPLDFPDERDPDYADFVYFSLGIGMTSQVADVQIASRLLRRVALLHQVLSFFFNTLILALAINIMASLI